MFSDYQLHLLNTKPKNLNETEKVIRRRCIRRIEYLKIKQQIKIDRQLKKINQMLL